MRRKAAAGESSFWSSNKGNVHTQLSAADPGRLRRLRGRAGPERRLLRALRRAHATRAAPGPSGDTGRAALLPLGGRPGGRFYLDLLRPAIALRWRQTSGKAGVMPTAGSKDAESAPVSVGRPLGLRPRPC